MKKLFFVMIAIAITSVCSAQMDTIFANREVIPCSVKEITQDAVKYSHPNEDLLITIYKNTIQKIVFKSGRVQTFAESTSYKTVDGVEDFENVTITQVESEVKGLYKLGDVSAKAVGTTTLSNQERVKQRAYRKMKIVAAMMGANIVYLTNIREQGNIAGTEYQAGQSAETSLTGVAYSNKLPNLNEFQKLIGNRTEFLAISVVKLYSSDSDMSKRSLQNMFKIENIKDENGLIMINGSLEKVKKNNMFRVVDFDNEHFDIFYKDKNTAYSVRIEL